MNQSMQKHDAQSHENIFSPAQSNKGQGSISPFHQNRHSNVKYPDEIIPELPEKENPDNTNDFDEKEFKENAKALQGMKTPNQTQAHKQLHNIHKSIETDQDFNCRDDREEDASQLSKSQLGAKSKFSGLSKANSNVIEQNLNFIDNMVNHGSTNPPRISNNKTPISQKSGLSPHAVSG